MYDPYKNRIFIDIPYSELKKAIIESEKKRGICEALPHGRFTFDFVMECGSGVNRVEEEDGNKIKFEQIVCEALGGRSTGCAAPICRNCIIYKCKHKRTRKVKCPAYPLECESKTHLECIDCGTYVDLLKRNRTSLREMRNILSALEEEKGEPNASL